MPQGLQPPCRIDQLSFPLFAVDWFAEVRPDGEVWSWVAYCGGGGSARTGVRNNIIVLRNEDLPVQISTGDQAGCSVKIYQHPESKRMWMLVALGTTVKRFSLSPRCQFAGEVDVGEKCEHLAISPNADQFAIGVGEEGPFKVYGMTEGGFATPETLLYTCKSHTKSLTSMAYSPKGDRLITAARDGTAQIWKNGKVWAGVRCTIDEPNDKKGRPQQVLVRGCAFADTEANYIITVHSGRKSKAYISMWRLSPGNKYKIAEKTQCSPLPATALSISMDKKLIAIGVADGSVILWDKTEWNAIKTFQGVHELPVTCIAARPLLDSFVGEDIRFHARTGSLDCNTGLLTLETRVPKKPRMPSDESRGFCGWLLFLIFWTLSLSIVITSLTSMFPRVHSVCSRVHDHQGMGAAVLCYFEEVLYTNPSKLGIPLPPV